MKLKWKLYLKLKSCSYCLCNTETLFMKKARTIFAKGVANARMRGLYDVYGMKMDAEKLPKLQNQIVKGITGKSAFLLWHNFHKENYAKDLSF